MTDMRPIRCRTCLTVAPAYEVRCPECGEILVPDRWVQIAEIKNEAGVAPHFIGGVYPAIVYRKIDSLRVLIIEGEEQPPLNVGNADSIARGVQVFLKAHIDRNAGQGIEWASYRLHGGDVPARLTMDPRPHGMGFVCTNSEPWPAFFKETCGRNIPGKTPIWAGIRMPGRSPVNQRRAKV